MSRRKVDIMVPQEGMIQYTTLIVVVVDVVVVVEVVAVVATVQPPS